MTPFCEEASLRFDAVLVPQGAEHQAVARALSKGPPVYPVPAGAALGPALVTLLAGQSWQRVLLLGLCGSLEPNYGIGAVVRYGACVDKTGERLACDEKSLILAGTPTVLGFTSDHVVHLARDKRDYGLRYMAQVVDMEGLVALRILAQHGISCAMVRVVSDDCSQDLPDLSRAFNAQGQLQPMPLALALLGSPSAGLRLIQGSLRALSVLERVARLGPWA